MRRDQVEPDAMAYTTLITDYVKEIRWRKVMSCSMV